MMYCTSLKCIPFNYIRSVLSHSKFPCSSYFVRSVATLRNLTKAFLITRTYQFSPECLRVEFNDALTANLHYAWLRDSCRCQKCIHSRSQQKLFETTSLELGIKPRFCYITEKGALKIVWFEKDGDHVSEYDPYWLHRYALGFEKDLYEMVHDTVPPTECWTGSKLMQNLPEIDYKAVMQSETALNLTLQSIHKYGIIIMRNVPCLAGEVVKVLNRVANIKETRWGSTFHITTIDTFQYPACITQAEKTMNLHTDMDYLEKSPGIQAMHCLELINENEEAQEESNQSFFVDGFYVAEWLRRKFPQYFNILASFPVKFRLFTQDMEYCNYQPILKLTRSRNVAEVYFNNRLMAPLEGPSRSVLDFYTAYKVFGENIRNPENMYTFSFKPGDLVILNNRRVLHGGHILHFSKTIRHFEGCFADLDEVLARYRYFLIKKREQSEK